MPPGLAAGSQTCNAQAAGDDSDDLTKSEKLVIYAYTPVIQRFVQLR
ncbi:hypothetical protein NIES37_69460 (plasmid) [Tolypothrix tenuis PCC 7101]|uniref:Uncharacterized protein n=1 Tax=Tolypothrix tenuis PCC 7101 TaxID=231146 RepID=A0A1Z4NB28_9CYAN|nr:hypothetical protein NIES37_69460 [Tolypothrix tenuis PCC 7101]BAZ78144.1 hypothetical protein NIES50_67770 [Aulosira laxa NIES-50]